MRRALVLSGAGHGALALWAVVGAWLSAPFAPVPAVTEVSLISGVEFAALAERPGAGPPAPGGTAPPRPAPDPDPDPAPVPQPQAASPATDLAPAPGDTALPAPRVAPRAAAPPEPSARRAPLPRTAAEPVPSAEAAETPERVAAAAPEAATRRIVTEATREGGAREIARAPLAAQRPRARPSVPIPVAQPEPAPQPQPQPAPDPLAGAIEDAFGTAGGGAVADAAADDPGPPLTQGERDALRLAVQQCWNVDVGSEAASVVVTVGMTMTREGLVAGNEVRLVAAEGGAPAAREAAFQAARRAVLRCQRQGREGYDLPPEKYDRWREIEIVFNPAEMRLR